MTDNTQTVEESTSKLEELIEFPATLTFKFVGNNNDAASTVIAAFSRMIWDLRPPSPQVEPAEPASILPLT